MVIGHTIERARWATMSPFFYKFHCIPNPSPPKGGCRRFLYRHYKSWSLYRVQCRRCKSFSIDINVTKGNFPVGKTSIIPTVVIIGVSPTAQLFQPGPNIVHCIVQKLIHFMRIKKKLTKNQEGNINKHTVLLSIYIEFFNPTEGSPKRLCLFTLYDVLEFIKLVNLLMIWNWTITPSLALQAMLRVPEVCGGIADFGQLAIFLVEDFHTDHYNI